MGLNHKSREAKTLAKTSTLHHLTIETVSSKYANHSLQLLLMQKGTLMPSQHDKKIKVERVQLGVRMEKRLVKVLKAMAEFHDMSLGDLLEGIILHAIEGTSPFSEESIKRINQFKEIYGVDYDTSAAHQFEED